MTKEQMLLARAALGLTQQEFGLVIGYGRYQISRMERGVSRIPRHAALAIAWVIQHGAGDPWDTVNRKPS